MTNIFFEKKRINHEKIAGFVKYTKVIRILFFKIKFTRYEKDDFYNEVYIGDKLVTHYKEIENLGITIKIKGNNNIIRLPETNLSGYIEVNGDDNKITIRKPKRGSSVYCVFEKPNSNRELYVGESELIGDVHFRIIDSNRKIIIGDNCLFSYGIYVWTTDSHEIYDLETNERINYDKDVIIGNHVWVGRNSSIQKGSVIPDGCVIGANSFVNKEFTSQNSIIVGTPAKIVKNNIHWEYGNSV